jgi:replicative DNA helicase
LTKAIDRIDTLFNTDDAITGLSTGYTDLDENQRPAAGRLDHRRRPSVDG